MNSQILNGALACDMSISRRLRRGYSMPFAAAVLCFSWCVFANAQAGRRGPVSGDGATVLQVIARHEDGSKTIVLQPEVSLYENGLEQTVKGFVHDPSPARIVLLVDNSLTVRADVEKLEQAVREFTFEIFEGDKLLIVGYDENAEIVADWTDDPKHIDVALKNFRKQGEPHLFDALVAVAEEALRPISASVQKQAIVVIGDGLDRGSKTSFDNVLANLQRQNIAVYAVQLPDRTGGALRRDQPKPAQVIEKLTQGTGGLVFQMPDARKAANAICDELRKNRYVLSYWPSNASYLDARSIMLIGNEGLLLRSKTAQPATMKP